jgi:(2Fe-2S) ferredoxin
MERNELPRQKIVFVCVNERPPGERTHCSQNGGAEVHARLKEMVKERRLRSKIRVSKSGCMDRCEDGPNVMVFPDCRWYSGVGLEDLDALLEEVAAGLE